METLVKALPLLAVLFSLGTVQVKRSDARIALREFRSTHGSNPNYTLQTLKVQLRRLERENRSWIGDSALVASLVLLGFSYAFSLSSDQPNLGFYWLAVPVFAAASLLALSRVVPGLGWAFRARVLLASPRESNRFNWSCSRHPLSVWCCYGVALLASYIWLIHCGLVTMS